MSLLEPWVAVAGLCSSPFPAARGRPRPRLMCPSSMAITPPSAKSLHLSVTLLPPHNNPCDYTEPTWIIQNNLPHLRILDLGASVNVPCDIVLGSGDWDMDILADHYPAYQRWSD